MKPQYPLVYRGWVYLARFKGAAGVLRALPILRWTCACLFAFEVRMSPVALASFADANLLVDGGSIFRSRKAVATTIYVTVGGRVRGASHRPLIKPQGLGWSLLGALRRLSSGEESSHVRDQRR